jgi:hypothetical protein
VRIALRPEFGDSRINGRQLVWLCPLIRLSESSMQMHPSSAVLFSNDFLPEKERERELPDSPFATLADKRQKFKFKIRHFFN